MLLKGLHSIYLGESVPLESLIDVCKSYKEISFVSYFTVKPADNEINKYLEKLEHILLKNKNSLHLFGNKTKNISNSNHSKSIFKYPHIGEFFVKLK